MVLDPKTQFISSIKVKEFNKSIACLDKKEYDKAILLLRRVAKTADFKELWINLAVAWKGKNEFKEAEKCLLKALDPALPFSGYTFAEQYPLGLTNLGLLYFAQEQDDLAIKYYKAALTADPMYYDAIWSMSLAALRQYCSGTRTDLSYCWELYSYRFKRNHPTVLKNKKPGLTMWDFKSSGDSIVVLVEQGMGDAMMFGRYLSFLNKYFKDIYVQCTSEMDYLFSDYHTCRDAIETPCMVGVPMCSLGKILDYIPSGDWLAPKYNSVGHTGNILCVWSGNPEHSNSLNRNAPPGLFDRFGRYGKLHSFESRKGYVKLDIKDWETTISYLEQMDTVITIDSSIVHMCGSLGKPCIMLQPLNDGDFRWGSATMGTENMWYDSVTVIRNAGNWIDTMAEAEKCIIAQSN